MDFQNVMDVMFGKIQPDLGQTFNPDEEESGLREPGGRKTAAPLKAGLTPG